MKHLADPLFWIALWGGITGTVAIVFTWLSYRQDRSELVVDANLSLSTDKPEVPHRWRFEIVLRNRGRRPCYVEQAGIELTVKSIKWGETELNPTGPVLFHLYKGQEQGVIRLDESEKRSIVLFPFPDVYLDMMRASNKSEGTLLVIDSLGQELRHKFALPQDAIVKGHKQKTQSNQASEAASEPALGAASSALQD